MFFDIQHTVDNFAHIDDVKNSMSNQLYWILETMNDDFAEMMRDLLSSQKI